MDVELPLFLIVVFTLMSVCAVIGVTCCTIDTVINVKNYRYWQKQMKMEELDKQVGDIVEEKMNLGGGIDTLPI